MANCCVLQERRPSVSEDCRLGAAGSRMLWWNLTQWEHTAKGQLHGSAQRLVTHFSRVLFGFDFYWQY